MRLLNNNSSTLSIINALNEGLIQSQADSTSENFYDYVDKDFNLFLHDYDLSHDSVT